MAEPGVSARRVPMALRPSAHSRTPSNVRADVEIAVALFPFEAADSTEISFDKGDEMIVLQKLEDGWLQIDLNGKLGYAPSNHVRIRTERGARRRELSRHQRELPKLHMV